MELNKIYNEDCLEGMKRIPDKSVDMILCDLPYGTTVCKWDTIIPFEPLWEQYERVIKDNGAIVLTATQPFTSALIMSNINNFKYNWTWDKVTAKGHLVAKYRPMQQTEDICVFGKGRVNYYPIMELREKPRKDVNVEYSRTQIMGGTTSKEKQKILRTHKYPKTILRYSNASQKNKMHPTQKPAALFEYLIKTYTNENDTVLDNCMGSGTTAIAAINTNRNYIGFEMDEEYYKTSIERINNHVKDKQIDLFEVLD
ncbi:DNA-methyltransferase [Staphylococcus haemolyticus]|uniref:DNA-methyltransferase n=1 Tax=Staphylococcus haemolyticus TaxID=1283 RepID=UPI001F1C7F9C|nr:site-specific DNA-methyltransferase [Staphylococcus haemolyticus]MCE4992997.1 site-specific DNA-methyltransferase [Staphylococcus haemolyticus]